MLKSPLTMLIVSSGVAQAILLLGSVVMVLVYTPAAIGSYGVYATSASLISVGASLRLDYFAFFEKEGTVARGLVFVCGATLFFGIMVAISALYVLGGISFEVALYSVVTIFSFATFHLLSQYTLLNKDYDVYSKARIVNGLSYVIFLLVLQRYDVSGLIFSYCAAQLVASLIMYVRNPPVIAFSAVFYSFSYRIKERLANLSSTVIQLSSPAVPLLLGAHFFSTDELGVFFWLSQLFAGGAAIIKRSLMGYLSAELMSNGKVRLETLLLARNTLKLGMVLSIASAVGAWAVGGVTSSYVHGWNMAISLVPPFLLLYTADALLQPLGSLLPSLGQEKTHLTNEILRLVSVSGCMFAIEIVGGGIVYFAWLYSLAMILFYFIGAFLFIRVAAKKVLA